MSLVDSWEFLAGLGLFLLAMKQLEQALRSLAGRTLKKLIREFTDRRLKALFTGTFATALVQSSSLVGLMVLAFVGAGLLTLEHALGVIFGANLGTTLTGWIVTGLGFKLSLDSASLPVLAVGSLIWACTQGRVSNVGRLVTAIGLLLLGLGYMKSSVEALSAAVDVAALAELEPWHYLLFGAGLAAIIQSSSATMLITLAAMDAGLIGLSSAAAVAIGADLGTTTTILLGAAQGNAAKKRVALAHFLFNVTTDSLAFVFRVPLLALILAVGISDPLYSLVAFHTLFNLLGIILFFPFMGLLARLLNQRFRGAERTVSRFVSETTPRVGDAAVAAIEEETAHLIARVVHQNRHVFEPPLPRPAGLSPVAAGEWPNPKAKATFDEQYRKTKLLEGEIIAFALRAQREPLEYDQSQRLSQLLTAVREAVHSTKSLRDIRHDLLAFEEAPETTLNAYLDYFRNTMISFYVQVFRLRSIDNTRPVIADFTGLLELAHGGHDHLHREIYSKTAEGALTPDSVSSLLNVNRELLNSHIALIRALQEYHLSSAESEAVDEL